MKEKRLERFWILLIIIIIIIIGYFIYKSYEQKKDSDEKTLEINNFYNVDYLFNNSYINAPKTIEDYSSKDSKIYMYLDANNTMYIKHTDNKHSIKITGLPKNSKLTVYYNHLYDNYYEFLAKEDNNVYYSFINLESSTDKKFVRIGDNISKVYVPYYDKIGVYINNNDDFATNYIFFDGENLKYIDVNNKGQYILKSNLNTKKPYFDYICSDNNSDMCNEFMIYITFKNEVFYNGNVLKNKNNEIIYTKDVFSSFEITDDKSIDLKKITKKDLKKHKFLYRTYIIDDNKIVYQFDITNKGEKIIALNNQTNSVKDYIYETNKELIITFEDGTEKKVKADNNRTLSNSTIYDKNNSTDEKVLIKP